MPFIRCLKCGRTSFNLNDIERRYCGYCHELHPALGKASRVGHGACPFCAAKLDAASSFTGGRKPNPGDISVCIKCANWLAFTETLDVRPVTDDEISSLPEYVFKELRRLSQLVMEFKKSKDGAK